MFPQPKLWNMILAFQAFQALRSMSILGSFSLQNSSNLLANDILRTLFSTYIQYEPQNAASTAHQMTSSDRNSRTGNKEREIRAGSKISRP